MTMDCSFCGKAQWEVMTIIAGPNVYICDECIEACNDIVLKQARKMRKELIKAEFRMDREKRKKIKDFYHMWS